MPLLRCNRKVLVTLSVFVLLILLLFYISNSTDHDELWGLRFKTGNHPCNMNSTSCYISLPTSTSEWKPVHGLNNRSVFTYSAYLDKRLNKPVIKVIGAARRDIKVIHCVLWTNEGRYKHIVKGRIQIMKTNPSLPYTHFSVFILCDLPTEDRVTGVSITLNYTDVGSYMDALPIIDMADQSRVADLNVCVKYLWNNFGDVALMIEFIEMYKLLGASKFFFYKESVSADVEQVLKYYESEGTVVVLPWQIPLKLYQEIFEAGLQASLNDCIMRSVGRFNFTAMVDLDEFIIPTSSITLPELLKSLGYYNEYGFKNVFFYRHKQIEGNSRNETKLRTQSVFERTAKPLPYTIRSKYIARPEKVTEAGNHLVWSTVDRKKKLVVNKNIAMSFHYRDCPYDSLELCNNEKFVSDRTTQRYAADLQREVSKVCTAIYPTEKICPSTF